VTDVVAVDRCARRCFHLQLFSRMSRSQQLQADRHAPRNTATVRCLARDQNGVRMFWIGGGSLAYPIPGDETVVLLVVEAQAAAKASAPPVQPFGRLPSEQPLGKGRILLGGACLCLSIKIQHLYSTLIVTAALHHRCHPQSGGQLEAVLRTKPSCQPFVRCRNLHPYARRRMRRSVQHQYHLCVC